MKAAEPIELLSRALDQSECVIAGVRPEQGALPTPCRSWEVDRLLGHLLDDLRQFTARAAGGEATYGAPQAVEPGESARAAFRTGADGLLAAWNAAGELTGTVRLPGMGEVPARFPVDQQITELAVHTWDLAVATGQPTDLDPEVGETALAWGQGVLRPQFRGDEASGRVFGPEVATWEDAPVYDRLAAFYGREPA